MISKRKQSDDMLARDAQEGAPSAQGKLLEIAVEGGRSLTRQFAFSHYLAGEDIMDIIMISFRKTLLSWDSELGSFWTLFAKIQYNEAISYLRRYKKYNSATTVPLPEELAASEGSDAGFDVWAGEEEEDRPEGLLRYAMIESKLFFPKQHLARKLYHQYGASPKTHRPAGMSALFQHSTPFDLREFNLMLQKHRLWKDAEKQPKGNAGNVH